MSGARAPPTNQTPGRETPARPERNPARPPPTTTHRKGGPWPEHHPQTKHRGERPRRDRSEIRPDREGSRGTTPGALSSPPAPSRKESAMSPTARLRLALAAGAALVLGAALYVGRPTSGPAAA